MMSLLYYSRMRFIIRLLPLLLASPLPAHVISVYAAGKEGKLFPEDLSLRDPKHYSFSTTRSHVVYMTTFFMEALAEHHRGRLSLVHVYPSLVMTNAFDGERLPTWFKLVWPWLVAPVVRPFSLPPRECGERMLYLATPRFPAQQTIEAGITAKGDGTSAGKGDAGIAVGSDGNHGSGAYAVNWNGETIPIQKAYRKVRDEDLGGKVWKHTMRAFETIEAGDVFVD